MNFGEYIKLKRMEKGISLRQLASKIGISPSYMSDIEKGRRYAPDKEKLEQIQKVLFVTEEEIQKLYDLAGLSRNEVPQDLPEYIINNDEIKVLLRRTKESKVDDLLDNINYLMNNNKANEIVNALRKANYTENELKFLLKLINSKGE